jgi:poly-beta-1,6-N-acetyl-D-glucosamine synthase
MAQFIIPAAPVLVVFWTAALLLFYVYAGYPLLLALIGFFVRSKRPDPGYYPQLSVLIAAYNEEAAIAEKIEQTLALEYPKERLEILVLSDCSTDKTDEIVKSYPDSRVRLVRMAERRGGGVLRCHRHLSPQSAGLSRSQLSGPESWRGERAL